MTTARVPDDISDTAAMNTPQRRQIKKSQLRARGHNGSALSDKPMSQPDARRMIRRRAAAAGIAAPIGCHTFRASESLPTSPRCRQGAGPVPSHNRALRHAKETLEDGVAAVEREIGMAQLDGVLPVIGAVADVADEDILVTAAERYSVLRRFTPRFLAAFDFRSNTPNDPCWPPSIFSGRWIATALARCPNGRRRRFCRRSGAG